MSLDLPYYPRPELLRKVLQVLTTGLKQGVAMFAPRRQGKTWFLKNELIPGVKESTNWRIVYIDLWRRREAPDVGLVEALEAEVQARVAGSGLNRKLKLTKVSGKVKPPGTELGAEFAPEAGTPPESVLENRLDAAVAALVGAKDDDMVLLVLDEFQALAAASHLGFVAALRTALQKHAGRLVVVFTGSSRDALDSMFRKQKAPLFESAFPISLPHLDDGFVEDRIEFLRERTGVAVDLAQMIAVFDRLGRSPEYLNDVVLRLLIGGNADIETAYQQWLCSKRQSVEQTLRELKAIDLAVLQVLARDTPIPIFGKESMKQIAGKSQQRTLTTGAVQSALRRLRNAGLVSSTGDAGQYGIDDRGLWLVVKDMDTP